MTGKCKRFFLAFTRFLLFFFCILLIYARFCSDGFLFGYRASFVMSNSMEPSIPTYSLLLEKKVNGDSQLKVNDVITFLAFEKGKYLRVTHRLLGLNQNHIITKGDYNSEIDSFNCSIKDVESKVVFVIPYFLQGFVLICSSFFCLFYHRTNSANTPTSR